MRETVERVNGWVQEVVKETGLCGTRAVVVARVSHPEATVPETRHFDLLEQIMRDVELGLQINYPRNAVIIAGI